MTTQPLNLFEKKLAFLKEREQFTLVKHLNIQFHEITLDRVVASLPVTDAVRQPFGLLHGGVSVALAETVASVGAWLNVDEGINVVGLEINCNHIKAVKDGEIRATGTPIHRGRSTQLWNIEIRNSKGEISAISRCTLAVVK